MADGGSIMEGSSRSDIVPGKIQEKEFCRLLEQHIQNPQARTEVGLSKEP